MKKRGTITTTHFWIGFLYDDWEWSDGGRSAYRNWYKDPSDDQPYVKLIHPGMLIALESAKQGDSLCYEGEWKYKYKSPTMSRIQDNFTLLITRVKLLSK